MKPAVGAFASSSHLALRVDSGGTIVEANPAAREWLDYCDAREPLSTALMATRATGGDAFDVSVAGRVIEFALFPQGQELLLLGRDRSEQRQMAAVLRQEEARLRALLAAAPDAIVTVAHDGRIDFINPRGEQMFGHAAGTLEGNTIESVLPDWYRAPVVLAAMSQEGDGCRSHEADEPLLALRAEGTRFPVELSATPLDREGHLYITAIVRDVTEREAANREIVNLNDHLQRHVAQLTQLNGELESFSYSVSHDLRGPLRSIDGFSALLLEEYGDKLDTQACDYLERVRAATGRMADLIEGLLRLSRISRAELRRERVDLAAIARFMAEGLQREEPQRQVEFQIAPEAWAEGDRALLTVAMENLIGNAWKFTAQKERGRIAFGVDRRDGATIYRVEDNGAGFDPTFSAKLFTPFERLHDAREYPGTGIGLATVARIVQRHGGAIWASGKEGQGAVFYFKLS